MARENRAVGDAPAACRGWLAVVLVVLGLALGGACKPAAVSKEIPQVSAVVLDELPGAVPFDAETEVRIAQAIQALPDDYTPRTRHLRPDGSARYSNRLLLESSPYLRQHAHNPVNWYPWGEEAFEEARRRGVPVLMSVGYSTCHWCHVMEEESFEDEEIAALLNARYVAIKVDREERPDVDSI